MAFQPIVDLQQQRIVGHEALVRGPAGETAGSVLQQINRDNLYAFDQACRVKAIELAATLKLDGELSINFFPNAVYEPSACIRLTLEAATRTGFPFDRLTFEFSENEQIDDSQHIRNIIEVYRSHGFQVALDDFGTGYSGLVRLADLRPDIIKLDRALIADCDTDKVRLAIVASLTALGATIGIKIVAEGVERLAEVDALRETGVRFMQGFYFAKPTLEGITRTETIAWPAG
jgi:EAL domain-containing protein (putative c-di-GMP-specific phosphodiesterase class I)